MTHCAPVQIVSAVRHHLDHLSLMEAEMRTTTAILAGFTSTPAGKISGAIGIGAAALRSGGEEARFSNSGSGSTGQSIYRVAF